MNFVTSVFKKYINKNEIKQQDSETPTNNADQLIPPKKSDAEKHPPVASNSSTAGQIIEIKPTEEDETFQDAVTGPDSTVNTGETRKNEQTFLASAQISGQSSTQPSVNQSFAAKNPLTSPSRENQKNKMQDSETQIPQQELEIQQRDSITFNVTEADSLNTSMVDSLEAPKAYGLLPRQELSDSLEVLEFESSRESSTEPATFNAEHSNDYVSLSYILDDSIGNSSSGNTILESSLNVKRSPLEMSGISLPKRNNSEEFTNSKSEGALENLIRSVNETLVLPESVHQTNFEDPKQFNIVENLHELETKNMLEHTEQNEPTENNPLKSDTLMENNAEQNSVEGELATAFKETETLTKVAPESELKSCTNDIKNRNYSYECPNTTNINVQSKKLEGVKKPESLENSTNVKEVKPRERALVLEDAVISVEEKRETVQAETPEEMSKEEQIRMYERQETQELDYIIKKLEETTATKSAANEDNRVSFDRQDTQEFEKLERNFEENHVSFHRQDTQEFENLERKFEGIAESNSSSTTDDILDLLVARSQNSHHENELQRSDKPEIVDPNNQLTEVNEIHEKTNIVYQRQDTQEFENLERQYAKNVLDQLVSENKEDPNANKELNKSPGSNHRSDFLLSMIETTKIDKPSVEINRTPNKTDEPVTVKENKLHFSVENCSQIESIGNQYVESIKEGRGDRVDINEADINQEPKYPLTDQIREARPTTEESKVVEASQSVKQSETETAAKDETIQSNKSELEEQTKNAPTDTEQSANTEVNGRNETADGMKTATNKSGSANKRSFQRRKAAKKRFTNSSDLDSNDGQNVNGNNQIKLRQKLDAELKLPGFECAEDKRNGYKNETLNLNESSTEKNKLVSTENKSAANNETRNGTDFEQDAVKPTNNKTTLKIENSSNTINNYKKLLEQYEKQILEQSTQLEKLKTELSTNFRHFNNTEMAFSDLFEKYEKAKSVITLYKQNEDILVENIKNAEGQLSQLESKCTAMKRQSLEQIRRAQQETEEEKQRYRRDISNLQAQVKRLEIKAASLEIELSQKTEECQALANLCDEITGRQ